MCEDHDEARLQDHVVGDVRVVAGHHHHRLLAGYPLADVLLVLPPVHLPRLQRLQPGRPPGHSKQSDQQHSHNITVPTLTLWVIITVSRVHSP